MDWSHAIQAPDLPREQIARANDEQTSTSISEIEIIEANCDDHNCVPMLPNLVYHFDNLHEIGNNLSIYC